MTAVGDPNQAIYGWRGASVSNILNFGQFFPAAIGADVPSYSLTVNRRSDSRILGVANALAQPLYAGFDQVSRCRRRTGRRREPRTRSCTRPTTTSWPGWPER